MGKFIDFICVLFVSTVAVGYAQAAEGKFGEPVNHEVALEEAAIVAGVVDAINDFENKVYRVEVFGLRRPSGSYENLLESQFSVKTDVVAGCVVTSKIVGHAKGYNRQMKMLLYEKLGFDVFEKALELHVEGHELKKSSDSNVPSLDQILESLDSNPGIKFSDARPDPYRHPTTHPASMSEELDLDSKRGHGDGIEIVLFEGRVVQVTEDSQILPIPNAKIYRLNDSMLLKHKRHDLLPFTTDQEGVFKGEIGIFAASGRPRGEADDWVLYQTGTAELSVEASGFEAKLVFVRYEQPYSIIVLRRKVESGSK